MVTALQQTFQMSIFVQIVSGLLAVIALIAAPEASEVLRLILIVETVVNGIQLIWYLATYFLGFASSSPIAEALDPRWRYLDWILVRARPLTRAFTPCLCPCASRAARRPTTQTTPIMLLSLLLLVEYWYDKCQSLNDIFADHFVMAVVISIVFNMLMLLAGASVAFKVVAPEREYKILVAGFAPFLFAFFPTLTILWHSYTLHATVVYIATFCVWALYGVAAIGFRNQLQDLGTSYNLLDIVSKNIGAVAVAIFALTESRDC